MPLSEREQQILQEIEDQLYEQDPEFARGVSATTLQKHLVRNIRRGIAGFVAGFVLLVVYLVQTMLPIGIAAFLVMLGAAVFTYDNVRKASTQQIRDLSAESSMSGFLGRVRGRMRDMGNRDGRQ